MKIDGTDELGLRPLCEADIAPLVAAGYGDAAETASMVSDAIAAQGRGEQRSMVITRRCLAPDPRSFNGLRTTELVLGIISDIGEIWMTADAADQSLSGQTATSSN